MVTNANERDLMKPLILAFFLAAATFGSTAAVAGPDDAKWVGQCITDNAADKAGLEVVAKYCTCMNNKMSDTETQSISTWEKTHATERVACDKESGWR